MKTKFKNNKVDTGRRKAIKTLGVAAGAAAGVGAASKFSSIVTPYAYAASEPIKIGAQFHRTGIGASYGRWYERTATAAVKLINDEVEGHCGVHLRLANVVQTGVSAHDSCR